MPHEQSALSSPTKKMTNKPIIIKEFPGEAVDRHLKIYGHLPTSELCDEKGSCQVCNPLIEQALFNQKQQILTLIKEKNKSENYDDIIKIIEEI